MSIVLIATLAFGIMVFSGCSSDTATDDQTATKTDGKEYILIGRVNPASGFLAGFGEGTPDVEQKVVDAINADGGIYIKEYDKKLPLKLIVADSESSATKASEAATKLVLQDKVDLLIGAHTPLTVNSVSAVAERNKFPCITVECPTDMWLTGGNHYWSFHTGFTLEKFSNVYADIWTMKDTNKKVGFMLDNQDGATTLAPLKKVAEERGYTVVDPGLIPVGTKDYTTLINLFKSEGVEIIAGNMNTPDFATAWKQFHETGYIPKVATIGRACLFPSDVEALGEGLGEGLCTEVWWTPQAQYKSQLFGTSAAELAQWYADTLKKQPSAVLGYKYALMELVVDSLQRAQTLDPVKLREAIAATDLDTVIGHVKYNEQNYSEPNLVGGQWVKGKTYTWEQNILTNAYDPSIELSTESMIDIPGSK